MYNRLNNVNDMCCILVKPAGVEMPNKRILDMIADHNRHGFGFCTSSGKNCKTTNYDVFLRELNKVKASEACIVHMRWATHGSVCRSNCHPFYDKETGYWFAHNGVLPIASVNNMTDSEIAFRTRFVPALKRMSIESREFDNVVNEIRGGSRFAFMKGIDMYIYGDYKEFGNCYYSNLNWLPYSYRHAI